MQKFLIIAGAILILGAGIAVAQNADKSISVTQTKPVDTEAVKNLFEDITLLNLVNGINLSEEQITKILEANKKLQVLKDRLERDNSSLIKEVTDSFIELKSTLEKNEGVPPDMEKRAQDNFHRAEQIKAQAMDLAAGLEKEIASTLSDAQLEIINTFLPCLIPPKDLKSPVRVGQAAEGAEGIDVLRNLRKLAPEVYEKIKPAIAERYLIEVQKHLGNLSDEEKDKEIKRFLDIVDKARAMSDEDFELDGPGLAGHLIGGIKLLNKEQNLQDELDKVRQIRKGGPSRVGKYLLNPKIVPILAKRLAQLKNPPKLAPADLDKINNK